jgi:hypothetical protein
MEKTASLITVVYVDDGLIISKEKNQATEINKNLQHFELTVSGARPYTGIEIDQDPTGI